MRIYNSAIFSTIFLGYFLLSATNLSAQDVYQGLYQLGSYSGNASFEYRTVNEDTVFDGVFHLERSDLSALINGEDTSFSIRGRFNAGVAEGSWRFRFGTFSSADQTQLGEKQYTLSINGELLTAEGRLVAGKPQGEWQISKTTLENSIAVQNLFTSTIEFENGIPQRNFRIENESLALAGRFLRDGRAHDSWTLFSDAAQQVVETWSFQEGLLIELYLTIGEDTYTTPVFNTRYKQWQSVNLDQNYLALLKWYQKEIPDTYIQQSRMRRLLAENAAFYKKIYGILEELEQEEFQPRFQVRVPYFPMSETEKVQSQQLQLLQHKIQEHLELIGADVHLRVLQQNDAEVQQLLSAVNLFKNSYTDDLAKVIELYAEGNLEFVSISAVIDQLWPEGFPSPLLQWESGAMEQPGSYVGPGGETEIFKDKTLGTLVQMGDYAERSLGEIRQKLEIKTAHVRQQREILEAEQQMVDQVNAYQRWLESQETKSESSLGNTLKSIDSQLQAQLEVFSSGNSAEVLLKGAAESLQFMRAQDSLARVLAALPEDLEEIQQAYVDDIWNPFMATVMQETVKKRILEAYSQVLIPFFLERATKVKTQEESRALTELILKSKTRMLELRNEDTRKLERRLRKEKDPLTILELFQLNAPAE